MKLSQRNKLDVLWRDKVKEKAKYCCEYCGRESEKIGGLYKLDACHIVGRRKFSTRWGALINGKYDLCGFAGCFNCHDIYDEHYPLHDDLVKKVIGITRWEKIKSVGEKIIKKQDFEQIKQWILNA